MIIAEFFFIKALLELGQRKAKAAKYWEMDRSIITRFLFFWAVSKNFLRKAFDDERSMASNWEYNLSNTIPEVEAKWMLVSLTDMSMRDVKNCEITLWKCWVLLRGLLWAMCYKNPEWIVLRLSLKLSTSLSLTAWVSTSDSQIFIYLKIRKCLKGE